MTATFTFPLRQTGSIGEQVQTVLQVVRRHLKMDLGFISEFIDRQRVFRFTDAAEHATPLAAGHADPLDESYCKLVVEGRLPGLMVNAGTHPLVAALPTPRGMSIGAHLSVPIRLADGRVYGTLCCFSATPDPTLNARDLDILRMCSDIVAQLIETAIATRAEAEEKTVRVATVLADRAITMVYQPIYRLADDRLTGVEALARFASVPLRSPDQWFAEAAGVAPSLGLDLEFLAVETAIEALSVLPPDVSLSLNLSPRAVLDPRFAGIIGAASASRLVLELTEHAPIASYDELKAALASQRARGLRLAIDDIGAGHSSFRHVLELRPDCIKLDMSLTRNVDSDQARLALAESIIRFSRRMGCEVVAEGVETAAELRTLREVGITSVQGYLTGAPLPLAAAAALPASGGFTGALAG